MLRIANLRLTNGIKLQSTRTRHIHHAWFEESFKPSTKLPYVEYPILLFTIRQRINSPLCVQVYADTSTALRCDSATDAPLSMFTTKVAVNESPAPTVSATSTLGVSMDEISPLTSYMPLRTAALCEYNIFERETSYEFCDSFHKISRKRKREINNGNSSSFNLSTFAFCKDSTIKSVE